MEGQRLTDARYSARDLAILYIAWLGVLFYTVWCSWVSEDAYITFRVIDNFFHGYGLRWNTFERVQVYTHPFWMLLHVIVYPLWKNLFLETIFLSVICSVAAVALGVATGRKSAIFALALFFLPLMASKSFRDYTSSGLENPLGYLLYAVFGYVLVKLRDDKYFWFYITLAFALSLFNRLDTALFFLPAMGYLLWARRDSIRWYQIILGLTPLAAWFLFSLYYYGFLFPNTKYAKLNTGIDLLLYLKQGVHYGMYLLILDTPGAFILVSTLAFILLHRRPAWRGPEGLPLLPAMMAAGVLLYVAYIFYIGGDYMAGRFWAVPVFAAVWVWYIFFPARYRPDVIFLVACALITTYAIPPLFQEIRKSCSTCLPLKGRVIDARFTFSRNKLVMNTEPFAIRRQGHYPFAQDGKKIAALDKPPVDDMFFIGMAGFYAGPKAPIIDILGLADPLLARLPAIKKQGFYIGHFRRSIPQGYQNALEKGDVSKMAPALAKYYAKLRLITSGNLSDPERLKTIFLFNIGYYDDWKEQYLSKHPA